MKKSLRVVCIVAVVLVVSGCVGLRGTVMLGSGRGPGDQHAAASQLGPFKNNSSVQLEAARYQGNIEIRANKVVIKGRGSRATEIAGDVRISGNSCTLTALTVSGNVYLSGNNNDLSGANVRGRVISEGNNNSW